MGPSVENFAFKCFLGLGREETEPVGLPREFRDKSSGRPVGPALTDPSRRIGEDSCVSASTRECTRVGGAGQAGTGDVKVFNIPRKQAASTSGTKFELAETYSYEEFASRVVPQRALRHLTASRSPRLSSALSHGRP